MEETNALAELLWMLVWHPRTGVLLALLAAAAVIDLRAFRIPNALTVPGMVYALAYGLASGGAAGLTSAVSGLLFGLLLLLPMYLLRFLGAGDVKLMAMVGAFVGPGPVLGAALYSVLAGGVLALAWTARHGALGRLASNLRFIAACLLSPAGGSWRTRTTGAIPTVGKLPFALGICLGTAAWLVVRQLT